MFCKFALFPLALTVTLSARGTTLSDNLADITYSTEQIAGSNWVAAGFSTGAGDYKLSSVTALFQQDAPGALNVALYSNVLTPPANDLDDEPGMLLGHLSVPTSIGSSLGQITFNGNNLPLAPNTIYWIVLSAPVSGTYEWAYALDSSGSGVGFYPSWGFSQDSDASWFTSAMQPMQMRVFGTPVPTPEPKPAWLFLLGWLILLAVARRRRFKAGLSAVCKR